MSSPVLLKIDRVSKTFRIKRARGWRSSIQTIEAVKELACEIRRGEHLGLVGESGSGKSTLAKLILRLEEPDRGRIVFDGVDVTALQPSQLSEMRQKMHLVFQNPFSSLDPRFRIKQILMEPLIPLGKERPTREAAYKRMHRLLEEVGLSAAVLDRYPHEFSGGERQRIALARALMVEPKLLILDEAVSALDVLVQQQILSLLEDIAHRHPVTYLFISHNLKVVRRLCPYAAVMWQGRIVENGPTEAVFSSSQHPYTKQLVLAAKEYSLPQEEVAFEVGDEWIQRRDGHGWLTITKSTDVK